MTSWADERKTLSDQWFRDASVGLRETYVYRYYDADGALLYVGQTAHPETRDKNHRNSQPWYELVAGRTLAGPFTKDIALAHEFCALQHEDPIHNQTRANGYRGPYSLTWHIAESDEYQRRCEADPDFHRREMLDIDIFAQAAA